MASSRGARLLPFALLGCFALGVWWWVAGGDRGGIDWGSLAAHQAGLRARVAADPALAGLAYVGIYAAVVGASLPAGGLLSVAGGVFFGAVIGTLLAVFGASLGAIALFLLARGLFGRLLAARAAPLLDRVRPALERDGFWGLLAMRLIPVVPFWLGNLAPALLGMRLLPYAAATVIGIIPATAVLVSLGAGLGGTLAIGRQPDAGALLAPGVLLPILGLAALSLLPIAVRRVRARHGTV